MKIRLYRWPEMWQLSFHIGPFEFRVGSHQIALWRHLGNNNFRAYFNRVRSSSLAAEKSK